jgi:NADPH:quinone reductase
MPGRVARVKAWQVTSLGEPAEALELVEVPEPRPGEGQLVVRVRSAALSYPDALMCRGQYQVKPPLPFTLGVEAAGEVTALGPGVDSFAVGDRVLGMLGTGGLAEFALFDAARAFPAPDELDDDGAAALHMNYQTAHFALHRRAGLTKDETVLVHAAAGGVGSAAIQLAKAAQARVIAVVGGPAKVAAARELGADVVVDRHTEDFVAVVKELTGGAGADVVIDPVGGEAFSRSTKCIAFEGRIVVIGFTSGSFAQAATNHVLIKNYSVLGLHWGMYQWKAPRLVAQVHDELVAGVRAGVVRPLITERLVMAEAPAGIARLAAGQTTGRLVVHPYRL